MGRGRRSGDKNQKNLYTWERHEFTKSGDNPDKRRPHLALKGKNPVTTKPKPKEPVLSTAETPEPPETPETPTKSGRPPGGSPIDNFIFFYPDGEVDEKEFQNQERNFSEKYCVDYYRLGWTSHHVLVFRFDPSLLGLKDIQQGTRVGATQSDARPLRTEHEEGDEQGTE